MNRIVRTLRDRFTDTPAADRRTRLDTESLDERAVPTVSAIASGFNGTAIAAGDTVWFSSVMKVSGLGSSPVTVRVHDGAINAPQFTRAVPDALVTFSPAATTSTTTFDPAENAWKTTVPSSGLSGNVFLAGVSLPAPAGLPGGVKPVTWQADFTTDTPGVTVKWQWAAAAYTNFATDYAAVGVKPVDDNRSSDYKNSDHAGTPEAFKAFVVGGARGGGGSNFTGSYSGTAAVKPDLTPTSPPPPAGASLSGYAFWDVNGSGVRDDGDLGLGGVTVTLSWTDEAGNEVTATALTNADGFYQFTGLKPGTYALTESQPDGFEQGANAVGSIAGSSVGAFTGLDQIGEITLLAGQDGVDYNFGEFKG